MSLYLSLSSAGIQNESLQCVLNWSKVSTMQHPRRKVLSQVNMQWLTLSGAELQNPRLCFRSDSKSPCQHNQTDSRGTGRDAIPLGFTRFQLLQRRAVCPLTYGKLEHLSAPSAIPSGRLGVHAGFGAETPLGPVTHLAVLRKDAGLHSQRQVPGCAEAGGTKRGRNSELTEEAIQEKSAAY